MLTIKTIETKLQLSGFSLTKINNYLYINGGCIDNVAQNTMYKMDLKMNVIKIYRDENYKPRTSHSAVYDHYAGEIYFIFGSGILFGKENISDIAAFNIKSEKYRIIELLPELGRYGHSSIINNREIIIYGGTTGLPFLNEIIIFDIISEKYIKHDIIQDNYNPAGRYKHTLEKINEDTAIMYGGSSHFNHQNSDLYSLNLKTLKWTLLCNIPNEIFTQEVVLYKDNLIIYGGISDEFSALKIVNIKNYNTRILTMNSQHNKFHKIFVSYEDKKLFLYVLFGKTLKNKYSKTVDKILLKTLDNTFNFIKKYIICDDNIVETIMSFIY
jgi:hypothetical protein